MQADRIPPDLREKPRRPVNSNVISSHVHIRPAQITDACALAKVAWLSKKSWGYSLAQLEVWREDLTPSHASIAQRPTYVAELDGALAGFVQVDISILPAELEHFWVHPQYMRRGVGRSLLSYCAQYVAARGTDALHVDSDPFAEPFYLACGAVRIGVVYAPIDGEPERVRPQLLLPTTLADS